MSLFEDTVVDQTAEDVLKKYKDQDAVAKALVEKDNFIKRLQNETLELRQELNVRPNTDKSQEILDRLEALRTAQTTERPEPTVTERVVETNGLTLDDVERLLSDREKKRLADQNVEIAKNELKKLYGPDFGKVLQTVAEKLGVNEAFLQNTASTSPQALLRLVASEKPANPLAFTPPSSTVTNTTFTPSAGSHQKLSYYMALKETDKKKYFSSAVQNQMYKDGMALKEEFHDI